MSIVYVVQEPLVKSQTGGVRPAVDISPAKRFGQLVYLLDWTDAKFDDADEVLDKLDAKLRKITEDDYLLMTGSPTAFAAAAIIASEYIDNLTFLLWDRSLNGGRGDYKAVTLRLGTSAPADRTLPSQSTTNTGARR